MKKIIVYITLVFYLSLTACSSKKNKTQPLTIESTQCNECLHLSKCVVDYAEPRLFLYNDSNQLAHMAKEACQDKVLEFREALIKIAIQNNASKEQVEKVKIVFDEQIHSFLKKNVDDLRFFKLSDIH